MNGPWPDSAIGPARSGVSPMTAPLSRVTVERGRQMVIAVEAVGPGVGVFVLLSSVILALGAVETIFWI